MKIKNRLNLNAFISLGAVIVIILSLVWSYQEDSKANRNMDLVEEIRNVAFERIMLRDDYLLHAEERAKIQWHVKSETMRRLLDMADQRFTDSNDRVLLREARKDFDATHVSISAFMERHKRKEPSSTKDFNLTEAESMLISQAFLKAYSLTDRINKLHVSTDHKLARVRERSIVIVVFFMFAGITVILANSMILNRLLNKRIAALGKGIEIIGAGDLDYRVDARGDDELSALALGANEMAGKLKMSHTSLENLQKEIAERKEAEENLKQTVRLNQILLDAFPCVALLLHPRTREIVASNVAAIKVGAVPGACCFSTWGQRQDPCPWCLAPAVWDTGKEHCMEVEAGGICWDAHWIPVSEDLYMHFAFDITDRKRTAVALRENEERLRVILDSTDDGILAVDASGKTIFLNRRFLELWRIPQALADSGDDNVLLGFVLEQLVDPDGFLRKVKRLYGTADLDYDTILFKDGRLFERYSMPMMDFGSVIGRLWSFRDITDRKRAEEENERLQDQLQQAMKMEAVGRLAGGVAHDFNNLLTVINGYSELLIQRLGENSPMRKDAEEILQAGSRAELLTRQLLAFSRKQVLQPKVIDLNMVVSKTGKMLRRLIGENIEFRTILAEGLGRVKADEGQVEQILLNLAINARDAMPGGGELTIETTNVVLDETFAKNHPSLVPGPHVLLSVRDAGSGIPDEIRRHIFEPFFTTKEQGKGTGLGLATVYGIVQQSQGHLDFHTESGKGTTFRIYLPRVEEESEVLSAVPTVALQGSEAVLVVEDENSVREIINRVLSGNGYRVLMASDGNEGLRISGEYNGPIDLLLTDLVMPGMGGRELATRLEAERAGMKVLFMSGYTENAISHQGVLDAGLSFIQKPFTTEALLRKVREILDGK